MRDNSYLIWCATEAQNALRDGHPDLASRYLEKITEALWCVYCHEPVDNSKSYHGHFKGYVHDECAENYSGRLDYERQHEI